MIQQKVIPNNKVVNLTFEIPDKFVGKSLKVFIDFEKDEDNPMTENQFEEWIDNAEKSENMTLETFAERWEKKKKQLKSHIL